MSGRSGSRRVDAAPPAVHGPTVAPRISSLSVREVGEGDNRSIFVNGEEFREITAVWFGEEWSRDYRVDGETVITAVVPALPAGSYYVVLQTADGAYSETHDQCVIEVKAASAGPVAAELSLESITPSAIYIGAEATYWVKGTGMLGVSAVMLGSSACTFAATDDQTLVITVPEVVREVTPGTNATLWVYPRSGDAASLSVETAGPDPVVEPTLSFSVWAAIPAELPVDGGILTLEGDGLDSATEVWLGGVACTIVEQSQLRLRVSVPSLAGNEGSELIATVVNNEAAASNASGVGVRVAA
jgi:IPT/TIG domain